MISFRNYPESSIEFWEHFQQAGTGSGRHPLQALLPDDARGDEPVPQVREFADLQIQPADLLGSQLRDAVTGDTSGCAFPEDVDKLRQREACNQRASDHFDPIQSVRRIETVSSFAAHWFCQEAEFFVVTDRVRGYASRVSKFAGRQSALLMGTFHLVSSINAGMGSRVKPKFQPGRGSIMGSEENGLRKQRSRATQLNSASAAQSG